MSAEIADELRKACSGHPHAKIAWPHRLLHRAADELDAKDKQIAELEAALYLAKNDRANLADNVDRLEAELEAGGWQPIETAPTNRAILIRLPGLDYYGNDGVYAGMLVDMGTGRRWMTFGWAIGRDVGLENMPDEWMPLPTPPSLLNKEDRNG